MLLSVQVHIQHIETDISIESNIIWARNQTLFWARNLTLPCPTFTGYWNSTVLQRNLSHRLYSVPADRGEADVVLLYNGGVQTVEIQQQDVLVIESYKRRKLNKY